MSKRPPISVADYMVVALSPTLIFFLVGSLCFFLVEVFYQGQYPYRLLFVMAMFVMGIVALSRLAMEEGWAYAMLYAIGLAAVVAIALARFVDVRGPLAPVGPLINWSLMALVWWSAYKLVWDCTLMDDTQDASGEGLLQSIGLDRNETGSGVFGVDDLPSGDVIAAKDSRPPPAGSHEVVDNTPEAQLFDWFKKLVEPDKRPHAPGKWVIYFSLAALPLFGLGQWFIPVENLGSRRFAFWMMAIYVASGLMLLLNTSFLGLRRYLRQRRLEMPLDMAATWLSVGAAMVLALLMLVYLLPSPSPEYSLAQLDIFKSKDRTASYYSPGGPDGAKGESQSQTSGEDAQKQGGDKSSQQSGGDKSGKNNEGQKKGGDSKSGDKGASQTQGKNGNKSDGGKGEKSKGEEGKGEQGKGKDGEREDQQSSSEKQEQTKSGGKGDSSSSRPQSGKSDRQNQESQSSQTSTQAKPPSRPQSNFQPSKLIPQIPSSLGTILKWLFYLAVAILAIVFAWIYRKELIAAWKKLVAELQELWARWFGAKPQALVTDGVLAAPPRTFSSYADPFASGMAARVPLPELVRYSFEALEAWGRDHASPRATGQTPHEFAQQLSQLDDSVSGEIKQLADLYCQIAYARSLPASGIESVRGFWQKMGGTRRAA